MREWTIHASDELLDLYDMIFIEIHYIHKKKLSLTLKYHQFEVVTFENLDLENHRFEKVNFFSQLWAF